MSDSLLARIEEALGRTLDSSVFEQVACEVLSPWYPTLVRVPAVNDAGMDGHGEINGRPFILVCTTGREVLRNLTKSLQSHRAAGGATRTVVVATSQPLSGRRQVNLARAASELGFDLDVSRIYDRGALASLLYRNSNARKQLLDIGDPAPALSSLSWLGRSDKPRGLTARERVLSQLRAAVGDLVIVGKPGIGKTAVLEALAAEHWGLFDTGASRAELAEALLSAPPRVILDDAHLSTDRIGQLRALRRELALGFDIVATTWPGSIQEVHDLLPTATLISVEELSRAEILDVIREHGVHGPRELQAIIVRQSVGRPGIAATLSLAAVAADPNAVAAGDLLLSRTVSFYSRLLGPKAITLLATYALSGSGGLKMLDAASALGLSLAEAAGLVKLLAQGGALDEVRGFSLDSLRLRVLPEDLQFSLVKHEYADVSGRELLNVTLARLPSPAQAVIPLVGAIHRGADSLRPTLRQFVTSSMASEAAAAVATLGPQEAQWVLQRLDAPSVEVARSALASAPESAAVALLEMDAGPYDARHSHPGDPPRVLADFLAGPEGTPAVRERVARAILKWVELGGSPALGLEGLAACVDPQFRDNYADPGEGRTFTLVEHPQSSEFIQQLMPAWEELFLFLESYDAGDYRPLVRVVHHWIWPRILGFGESLPSEVKAVFESTAASIVGRLTDCLDGRPAILAELRSMADLAGLDVNVPGNEDFDTLFPNERLALADDHEAWARGAGERANAWAERVVAEGIEVLVNRLEAAETAAESVGRHWPRLTASAVATAIRGRPDFAIEVFRLAVLRELPGDYVGAALAEVAADPQLPWWQFVDVALDGPRSQFPALEFALTREVPADVLAKAVALVDSRHRNLLELLAVRDQLSDESLLQLLRHPVATVRDAVAGHWRGSSQRLRDVELTAARRDAITRGNPDDYWIRVALETDPELLIAWLRRYTEATEDTEDSYVYPPRELREAVSKLPEDDRVNLLAGVGVQQLERMPFSIDGIFSALVQDSPRATEALFANPALRRWQASALHSEVNQEWLRRARAAVLHGWSVWDVVSESTGQMLGWSGDESDFWDGFVAFFSAVKPSDPIVADIARAGIEHFSRRREEALLSERRESVLGFGER